MITGTKSLSFSQALRIGTLPYKIKHIEFLYVSCKVKMKEKNEHYNKYMICLGTYLII